MAGEALLTAPPGPSAEGKVDFLPARLVVLAPLPIPVVCGTTAAKIKVKSKLLTDKIVSDIGCRSVVKKSVAD